MRIPWTGFKYQSKADPYIPVTYELAIHNLTCTQVSCRRAETRGWTTDSHQKAKQAAGAAPGRETKQPAPASHKAGEVAYNAS
jgi:hypothetical protein